MQLLSKISSLVLLLFFTGQVFANSGEPDFIIKNTEKKTLYFEIGDTVSNEFEIQFKDSQGNIVFSEYAINPKTFVRRYNLSELPNGEYTLSVAFNLKTYVLPIVVEQESVKVQHENSMQVQ